MRSAWENDAREVCSFFVEGEPVPQGSKNAFVIPGTNRASVSESNAKALNPWRKKLKAAAAERMEEGAKIPKGTPVKILVTFGFKRPKSHFGTGRNAEVLKQGAPTHKSSAPDLDKLQRALGDALTGVCYDDDAQIAEWDASQKYSSRPGAYVYVYAL